MGSPLPVEKISEYCVISVEHPAPLVVHYPKTGLPVGVMNPLLVYLQGICGWKQLEEHGKLTCTNNNCIQFELPGENAGSLALINSSNFLEIHVKSAINTSPNLCLYIKEDIILGLQTVQNLPEPEIGFLCSRVCGNEDMHLALVDTKKAIWTCSKNGEKGGYLDGRQMVWLALKEVSFPVIREANIIAQTKINIPPNKSLNYCWKEHGFNIHVPEGAISNIWPVTMCIQASVNGNYQLPDDSVLVSGVYWLSLHPPVKKFNKNVTIRLQHCASDDDSTLTFVTVKCTQKTLPYTFKQVAGGSFSVSGIGSIDLNHFSGYALTGEKQSYAFCTYYIPFSNPNLQQVDITVTQNLELFLKVCYIFCVI